MWKLTAKKGLVAAAFIVSCLTQSQAVSAQEQATVVAVNYPLQYFAERLMGEQAEVVFPVPNGVDPSFWRPSISDISAVQSADLVLLNGAGFATWVHRVSLSRSKIVNTSAGFSDRYIATESITHSHGDGGEHSHEGIASYIWLDPSLAQLQAEAIASAVVNRGLADEALVASRLAELRADLDALNATARTALSDAADTVMIATHPRYQYFAQAYGLTIVSLEWEAGAAPNAEELDDLRQMVSKEGARVLIWESRPSEEALASTEALGLTNVVMSPLAHRSGEAGFVSALGASVSALAEAVGAP